MAGEIKEITVYTNGDSNEISTWSNIPYFLTSTLLSRGIKVNRVDLNPLPSDTKRFNTTVLRVIKKLSTNTTYSYFRSFRHYLITKRRITEAIRKFPEADVNLFLTFSFSSSGLTKKPTVLLCDWTYEYFLDHFKDRRPDFFEKRAIKREKRHIEKADLVIILFNSMMDHMKKNYRNPRINYLGNYVINSLNLISEIDLNNKKHLHNILFVGNNFYIEGAISLISALGVLRKDYPLATLHIVGMNISNFENLPEYVKCYGFLDKKKPEERDLFSHLFKIARVFVNTNPKWGSFSTAFEAMYSYIPVVVSPYDEFVSTFGKNIDFGCYCGENIPDRIAEKIRFIFESPDYYTLCTNAHNAVKDFTWSSFVDKLLLKIEEVGV